MSETVPGGPPTPQPLTKRDTAIIVVITAIICLPIGLATGFITGVAATEFGQEILEAAVTLEEPADVAAPQKVATASFSVEYPGNWKLDEDSETNDPVTYFSADTPGSNYFQANLYDYKTDPQANVDDQIEYYKNLLSRVETQPLNKWGQYSGAGAHLKGKYFGNKSEVRVFSSSTESESFVVVEFFDTASAACVSPGFDLIAHTFRYSLTGENTDKTLPWESEEDPAVDRRHLLATEDMRLEFPHNWTIDTYDCNPHSSFSIDTPGNSYVSISVYEPTASPGLDESLEYFEDIFVDEGETQPIDTWGSYSGNGGRLQGKYEGHPVEVRIFCHSSQASSFKVIEFVYAAAAEQLQPGFDLIASTFEYHYPEPEGPREPVEAPRPAP